MSRMRVLVLLALILVVSGKELLYDGGFETHNYVSSKEHAKGYWKPFVGSAALSMREKYDGHQSISITALKGLDAGIYQTIDARVRQLTISGYVQMWQRGDSMPEIHVSVAYDDGSVQMDFPPLTFGDGKDRVLKSSQSSSYHSGYQWEFKCMQVELSSHQPVKQITLYVIAKKSSRPGPIYFDQLSAVDEGVERMEGSVCGVHQSKITYPRSAYTVKGIDQSHNKQHKMCVAIHTPIEHSATLLEDFHGFAGLVSIAAFDPASNSPSEDIMEKIEKGNAPKEWRLTKVAPQHKEQEYPINLLRQIAAEKCGKNIIIHIDPDMRLPTGFTHQVLHNIGTAALLDDIETKLSYFAVPLLRVTKPTLTMDNYHEQTVLASSPFEKENVKKKVEDGVLEAVQTPKLKYASTNIDKWLSTNEPYQLPSVSKFYGPVLITGEMKPSTSFPQGFRGFHAKSVEAWVEKLMVSGGNIHVVPEVYAVQVAAPRLYQDKPNTVSDWMSWYLAMEDIMLETRTPNSHFMLQGFSDPQHNAGEDLLEWGLHLDPIFIFFIFLAIFLMVIAHFIRFKRMGKHKNSK